MKYTGGEQLDIGCRSCDGEISRYQAAEEYDIGEQTAHSYIGISTGCLQSAAANRVRLFPELRQDQSVWKSLRP